MLIIYYKLTLLCIYSSLRELLQGKVTILLPPKSLPLPLLLVGNASLVNVYMYILLS